MKLFVMEKNFYEYVCFTSYKEKALSKKVEWFELISNCDFYYNISSFDI